MRTDSTTRRARNAASSSATVLRALCLALPQSDALPEWIPYLPSPENGHVTGEDGRRWAWTVDQARAVCARVKRKLPVDINHSTEIAAAQGKPSPAYGWMDRFEVREDGSTWAHVTWTQRARNELQPGDYGFISPTFDHDKARRIVAFASAALLNEPNFENLAINARQSNEETAMLEQLLAALGVSATASADEAIRAVNTLKDERQRAINARETPDLQRYVPRADYDALNTRACNAEQKLAKIEADTQQAEIDREVDAAVAAGKITPATKDFYRASCKAEGGLEAFRNFVKATPQVVSDAELARGKPPETTGSTLTANQRAICKRLGMSEKDYLESQSASA